MAAGGYSSWQEALAASFFGGRWRGRSFVLLTDQRYLDSYHEDLGGAEGLIYLGRSYVGSESGGGIFEGVRPRFGAWLKGEEQATPPPVLPVLALSVLAATHMREDRETSPQNYYKRFRELLLLPGTGQPNGFESGVVLFWRSLRQWATSRDDLGQLLIPEAPLPAYVGYPISQALWSEADEERLTMELRDRGATGDWRIEDLMRVTETVLASGVLGKRARLYLTEPSYQPLQRPLMESVRRRLSGPPRPKQRTGAGASHQAVELVLAAQPGHRLELELVARRPTGWREEIPVAVEGFPGARLRSLPFSSSWYLLDGVDVGHALEEGLVALTEFGPARFEAEDRYRLQSDDDLGLLQTAAPWTTHVTVLARSGHGLESGVLRADPSIPDGWSRYDAVPNERHVAGSAVESSVSLTGGLRVGTRVYLPYGLPELHFQENRSGRLELVVDGVRESVKIIDGVAELPERCASLGRHTVEVESREFMLTVTVGDRDYLAYEHPAADDAETASPDVPCALISPNSSSYVLIGSSPDELVIDLDARPPGWTTRTGVKAVRCPTTDFSPVWCIQGRGEHRHASLVNPLQPAPPASPYIREGMVTWARQVLQLPDLLGSAPAATRELAELYRQSAAQIIARTIAVTAQGAKWRNP